MEPTFNWSWWKFWQHQLDHRQKIKSKRSKNKVQVLVRGQDLVFMENLFYIRYRARHIQYVSSPLSDKSPSRKSL